LDLPVSNASEAATAAHRDQHRHALSDAEIAQSAILLPIIDVARDTLGIDAANLRPYGHTKAKLELPFIRSLEDRPDGKLILVTAITPTPAGEGKTTTTVGLSDGLRRIGKNAVACLREPSLGPCFGMKGGAAGGGYAQVVPMTDINLHFTGDFHAITSANNLLAALIDNHIYWGNTLGIDTRRISWRRALDMNDRALRHIVSSMGGVSNGYPREDGFDITVASEVMAIICLSRDLEDLQRRLANIVVATGRNRKRVRAADLDAVGAMAVLLQDALAPNLVQTLEHTPAFVHGGPFANIAHGCNSVIATRTALKLADYVVTEAGFGADLGAEKFFDIKCRSAGLAPSAAVIVATIRALKMHGGVAKDALKQEDTEAVQRGFANLERHVRNLRKFGVPPIVAVNRFSADTEAEMATLKGLCDGLDVQCIVADHWALGGAGAQDLATAVVDQVERAPAQFRVLYPDDMTPWEKLCTIAREIYDAGEVTADGAVRKRFDELQSDGFGHLPVCVAKTQYSFSTDPKNLGAPSGHTLYVRDVRLSAGAEFIIAICGEIMTMPGLPKVPAANSMSLTPEGLITGLF
jgi:formate--tetrahydrofolate ligase